MKPRPAAVFALIVTAVLLVGAMVVRWKNRASSSRRPELSEQEHRRFASNVSYTVSADVLAEVLRIEAEERRADETYWAKEMVAQRCGAVINQFWDAINEATNTTKRWEVIQGLSTSQVILGQWIQFEQKSHNIEMAKADERVHLDAGEWRTFVKEHEVAGWELDQIEFRHNKFELDAQGKPSQSRFYFSAHLRNGDQRAQLEGDLVIFWRVSQENQVPEIRTVDASGLTIKYRRGIPPFKLVLDEEIITQSQSRIVDPLILYDLDSDGVSEIILAGRNLVYRNRAAFQFEREALCKYPEEFISTALVADFDGDNIADFLAHKWEGTFLFKGSREGRFDEKPRRVWKPVEPLQKPMVMSCGDIDADGDLDVFIAQYKEPYENGMTPQPFYDANDGHPAYLLLNEGRGNFRDATMESGLAEKRRRRTYSASFADVDRDNDLDLLVVSDFAGLDVYRNDGKGRFTKVTGEWVTPATATKAFGMAHVLSDFNNDGLVDVFMTGMTSSAIERLDHLRLERNESAIERSMRREMTHGNRLLLGMNRNALAFQETDLSGTIARSGWSWGCAQSDFDNDGWVDIYVANGLESNASVKDYEAEYWLHDRFVGRTNASSATDLYFKAKFGRTRSRIESYGGYEKNRFFLNANGREFFEAGYLLDVALPQDCRNLISDDFDGDGRMDLAVMTQEIWPRPKQSLKIFRNVGKAGVRENWIGFRFGGDGKDWIGAEVILFAANGAKARQIVTGDSYRSQHASRVHFGLGQLDRVHHVEIRRTAKPLKIISSPEVGRYHLLK